MSRREKRSEYYATKVHFLDSAPGNFDHGNGPKCVVLTVGRGTDIEHMAFDIADAKKIVAKMLVALATYRNELAQAMLDDHFDADEDGEFIWPNDPSP